MHLDPNPPANGGTMPPVEAVLPPASLLSSLPPASVGNHMDLGMTVVNTMFDALNQAAPDRGVAEDTAAAGVIIFSGIDDRSGQSTPYATFGLSGGGWGGNFASDGITFCLAPMGNCRTSVQEYVERENPVIVWQLE